MPYNPKKTILKYCKECGLLLGYRNKSGYCPKHFGLYNKEKNLSIYMINYNKKHGTWNTGISQPESVINKIKQTLKKTSCFKYIGANKSSTKAEDLFAKYHPDLERELYIKTSLNGGKSIWGCNWFRLDFFDKINKRVYEIDGSSHNIPGRLERDKRKEAFLKSINIDIVRISNEEVFRRYEKC